MASPPALLLLDLLVTGLPVRVLHFIYADIFVLTYMLFSFLYWLADTHNHVLYPGLLDWTQPWWTVIIVASVMCVLVPLVQGVLNLIYRGRQKLVAIL